MDLEGGGHGLLESSI